jgi:formylglycine-generating enzyme required for sulfatase activity
VPTNTPVPPTPVPTNTPVPVPPPAAGTIRIRPADGMEQAYVPAGPFTMGSEYGFDDEKPVHEVTLEGYWIDKYEVTNAQYRQCVEAGKCTAPTDCMWGAPTYDDSDKSNHPVACVDWKMAKAYCEWTGGRLPTEAEWEKAARGTDGRKYPWGNDAPDCNKAQYSDCSGRAVPVGSKSAGASPYGAMDMVGNVWEWTGSEYDSYPYDAGDGREDVSRTYVGRAVRGGSWNDSRSWDNNEANLRVTLRHDDPPDGRNSVLGFRCGGS